MKIFEQRLSNLNHFFYVLTEFVVTESKHCSNVSITKDFANETKKTVSETKITENTTTNPNTTEIAKTSTATTAAVKAQENNATNIITATETKSNITATEITITENTKKETDLSESTTETTVTENNVPSIIETNTTTLPTTVSSSKQTDTTSLPTTITVATMPKTTIKSNQTECSRSPLIDSTITSTQASITNTIPLNFTKLIQTQTPVMNTTFITITSKLKPNITNETKISSSIPVTTMPATTTSNAFENNMVINSESTLKRESVATTLSKIKENSEVNAGGCTCYHTHPTSPELPETTTTQTTTTKVTTTETETTHNVNICTCTPTKTETAAVPVNSQNMTVAETATSETAFIKVTTANVTQSGNALPEMTESENVTITATEKENVTSINMPVTETVTDMNVTTVSPQKSCKTTYPKDCEMPVTWETTAKGEIRDFFQILRDRYNNFGRRFSRTSLFTPFPTGVLIKPKRQDKFRFGRHVESSLD